MKMIILKKQSHNAPYFDELYRMLSDLRQFLDEEVDFNDEVWNENLKTIIDFQDDDGSFRLFDSYEVPTEARVDFCYMPTYLCSAILMKAYMTDSQEFALREKSALAKGLKMSCIRNLRDHGFGAFKGQIEALNIFMKAGLREFMDLYPDLCPEFSEMIRNITSQFHERQSQGNFLGPWKESYESEIRAVNEYFSNRNVFVYGTLMRGEANEHYLEGSVCIGPATIECYDMYNVGWYPAIISGDGLIVGELYRVPLRDIPAIDMLEGEGSLYTKRCETVKVGRKTTFALVYVYNGDCLGLERIPAWKNDYVWYVSYGSNMLGERFKCYIEGGDYGGSRYHPPCEDTTPPVAVKTIDIPFGMYFGNVSSSWHGSGVSFLNVSENGHALGVAYLITRKQFEHVVFEENSGRHQSEGGEWYEHTIDLDPMYGFEVKTITNRKVRDYNDPFPAYLDTLRKGIRENWPDMLDEDMEDYLNGCIR